MESLIDVITVFHNDEAYIDSVMLQESIENFDGPEVVNLIGVDNRLINRGFSKACNLGASLGKAPIIGFINPDATVYGPFASDVLNTLKLDENIMVTGSNFGKPEHEYKDHWGCDDWVCGAAFFVKRDWFEYLGGFDERYVWSWEESDFIRKTQQQGKRVVSIELNIQHASPEEDSIEDSEYKRYHFQRGAQMFYERWGK